MADFKRVSVSIPNGLSDDLDYIASRLGISRSGLVTQLLLGAGLDHIRALLSNVPEQASDADTKRFRGNSKAYIESQLDRLRELQGGLFDDSAK